MCSAAREAQQLEIRRCVAGSCSNKPAGFPGFDAAVAMAGAAATGRQVACARLFLLHLSVLHAGWQLTWIERIRLNSKGMGLKKRAIQSRKIARAGEACLAGNKAVRVRYQQTHTTDSWEVGGVMGGWPGKGGGCGQTMHLCCSPPSRPVASVEFWVWSASRLSHRQRVPIFPPGGMA